MRRRDRGGFEELLALARLVTAAADGYTPRSPGRVGREARRALRVLARARTAGPGPAVVLALLLLDEGSARGLDRRSLWAGAAARLAALADGIDPGRVAPPNDIRDAAPVAIEAVSALILLDPTHDDADRVALHRAADDLVARGARGGVGAALAVAALAVVAAARHCGVSAASLWATVAPEIVAALGGRDDG